MINEHIIIFQVDALTRTLAATASGDFSAKLWCANTGKELYDLKHKHVVKSVDFSVDTLRIATGEPRLTLSVERLVGAGFLK